MQASRSMVSFSMGVKSRLSLDSLDSLSPSSSSGSIDVDDCITEGAKSGEHVKKKWKNLFGAVKKRKQQFRKSASGGDILAAMTGSKGIKQASRHTSCPTECLTVREYKHENIYRGLLHSLLHPMVPGETFMAPQANLLDHLRDVFDVENGDHDAYIKQELFNKKGNYDFSTEDYYRAFKQFLTHSLTEPSLAQTQPSDRLGQLPLKAHRILKKFAEAHDISKISQAIVNVTCLLEIRCEREGTELIEFHIRTALDDLQKTWTTMQIGEETDLNRMPLTDSELANFRRAATRLIEQKCEQLYRLPHLFPPSIENLNLVKSHLGVPVQLLGLDLWESKCDPKIELGKRVLIKLKTEVSEWMEQERFKIPESNQEIGEKVIPEMQRIIDFVTTVTSYCNILPANKVFHASLGINYYKVISLAAEDQICYLAIDSMNQMNQYKKKYNNFSVNIMSASKLSLRLYFVLRTFGNVIRDNVSSRDFFRSRLFHYQEWFEESLIYWLHTFRTECISRMEKALEIEKEVVAVTSLVKYSNSSVDALICFAKVISEWKNIDFRDADFALMGVTKITDMVCDGSNMYAQKVQSLIERNNFFDDSSDAEFDVNERLCITLNNIEHVRLYLGELPELLSWETVVTALSMTHGNEEVRTQAMDTLQRLIDTCNEEILTKRLQLLKRIAEKLNVGMDYYVQSFTRKEPFKSMYVDQVLDYVSANMQTLHDKLMPDIFPSMIEELWTVILKSLGRHMLIGKKIDYYAQMKQHLQTIQTFFHRSGLDEKKIRSCLYDQFKERLELNSKKSEELMLLYHKELVSDMRSPAESYGQIAFKAAYMEEMSGNMTIYVTVLRGNDQAHQNSTGYKNSYVEVSLQPEPFFSWCSPQRTRVVKQTVNTFYNDSFQFPNISKEYLHTDGASVRLSVYNQESIMWDTFTGEVVVHIQSLPKVDVANSMENLPVTIMSLKRPRKPFDGPFAVLRTISHVSMENLPATIMSFEPSTKAVRRIVCYTKPEGMGQACSSLRFGAVTFYGASIHTDRGTQG